MRCNPEAFIFGATSGKTPTVWSPAHLKSAWRIRHAAIHTVPSPAQTALFIEISTLVVANFHTGWAQSATQAMALYGSLPDQLKDPNSFASQITKMLAARKQHRIAEAQMLAVPPVGDPAVCVLVMRLPDSQNLAITALN
jgi:hypothetical protein